MSEVSTITEIAGASVAIITGVAGGVGLVARLLLAPILLRLTIIENTLAREHEEIKRMLEAQDERHRRHTGNTEKHISAEWRTDLDRRLQRIENYLAEMSPITVKR